ncbi:TATA box-binding protein-associated factor RNA polymerase I subunit B [Corythoichthys intestinalis]|uniref:TATA box-binding protein-associated factor RNA polymerase I subunit B n=1 Tax=Corythoichthys intestinalis TaxID=161448 RepID=UPI0025A62A0A|nr:TATA box-binding protein-associated factor RNA polymerase I subunit B [Corythoichthys intestinalis]
MEEVDDYREPCLQCGSVHWSISDEGRFFCTTCHNVIERTREVEEQPYTAGSSRVTTLGREQRVERRERGYRWAACEGFQFILSEQAAALVRLGVAPAFKDQVLWPLWRRYLRTRREAHGTLAEKGPSQAKAADSDWESDVGSSFPSTSETDNVSQSDSRGDWSSDSRDVSAGPCTGRVAVGDGMSMRRTLALIHLALVWSRQALTLGDLIGLADDGYIPYLDAYRVLPEEMKLDATKVGIFAPQSVPRHGELHREARTLQRFLRLPAFPPVRRQDPLHPEMLALRYLADANLPDDLHPWVCALLDRVGEPSVGPNLPEYDLRAAALVVLALKLFFGLDDHTEWDLSNAATASPPQTGSAFSLRRWYRLLHAAKLRAELMREDRIARKRWKSTLLYSNKKVESKAVKRQRNAEHLKSCFEQLRSRPASRGPSAPPSTFTFLWGEEPGADGPNLRRSTLAGAVRSEGEMLTPVNAAYWHPPLKSCNPRVSRICSSHYAETEPTLPRSFVWVVDLFAFMLRASPARLYREVLSMEKRVLAGHVISQRKKSKEGL